MSLLRVTPAIVLTLALTWACASEDAATEDLAADTMAAAPAAATPPAELQAAADESIAAWNQEDPAVVAAFFTEGATVVDDDTATYNGRQEIQTGWIQGALPVLSNLQVEEVTWEPVGQDYRASGRYRYTATLPEGEMQATGRYENVWTQDTDGKWRVRSGKINSDPVSTTGQ